MASLFERRERIRLREPGISESEVNRLMTEDPVSQHVNDYRDFDHVVWNTGDDPVPACREAIQLVSKFTLVEA